MIFAFCTSDKEAITFFFSSSFFFFILIVFNGEEKLLRLLAVATGRARIGGTPYGTGIAGTGVVCVVGTVIRIYGAGVATTNKMGTI